MKHQLLICSKSLLSVAAAAKKFPRLFTELPEKINPPLLKAILLQRRDKQTELATFCNQGIEMGVVFFLH